MSRWRWLVVAAALACAIGCNSDDPLKDDSQQLVELQFVASAVSSYDYYIWDDYLDANHNGQIDPADTREDAHCEFISIDPVLRTAPWPFEIQIKVIHGGTVQETLLTRATAASTFSSLTEDADGRGPAPAQPEFPDGGHLYANGRRVPETSNEALDSCIRPQAPGIPQTGQVGGLPVPVQIPLSKGDTLVVTGVQASSNAGMPYTISEFMNVVVLVNGVGVTPDGFADANDLQGSFSFSYQYR